MLPLELEMVSCIKMRMLGPCENVAEWNNKQRSLYIDPHNEALLNTHYIALRLSAYYLLEPEVSPNGSETHKS